MKKNIIGIIFGLLAIGLYAYIYINFPNGFQTTYYPTDGLMSLTSNLKLVGLLFIPLALIGYSLFPILTKSKYDEYIFMEHKQKIYSNSLNAFFIMNTLVCIFLYLAYYQNLIVVGNIYLLMLGIYMVLNANGLPLYKISDKRGYINDILISNPSINRKVNLLKSILYLIVGLLLILQYFFFSNNEILRMIPILAIVLINYIIPKYYGKWLYKKSQRQVSIS